MMEKAILKYNALDIFKAMLCESFWNPEDLVNTEIVATAVLQQGVERGNYDYSESGHKRLMRYSRAIKLHSIKKIVNDIKEDTDYIEEELNKFYIESVVVLRHQLMRGEVYLQQSIEAAKELYTPLDEEFMLIYGFRFQDVLHFFIWVYKHYRKMCQRNSLEETEIKDISHIPLEINISTLETKFGGNIVQNILRKLGTTLDKENEQHNSNAPSKLLMRPIVIIQDKIIIPTIRSFLHNLFKFFHFDFVSTTPLITERDQDKLIKAKYSELRGDLLENLTMRYFGRLFNEENIYQSLNYGPDYEADITVSENNKIILAECKGKILTFRANQGDYEKIKSDFGDAIQSAYKQACRTEEAILNGETFRDDTGRTFNFPNPQNIYKLCVTLDTFGNLSTQLQYLLKRDQDYYPLACNIFDLDIITKECSDQKEFLSYLEMRSKEHASNNSVDELDYFMQFKMRTRLENNQFSEVDMIVNLFNQMVSSKGNTPSVIGYANDLDKKYENASLDYLLSYDL